MNSEQQNFAFSFSPGHSSGNISEQEIKDDGVLLTTVCVYMLYFSND